MLRKGGKSTAINSNGRKTIQTTFEDGAEMVEEYDLKTEELLLRKRREKTTLGGDGVWEYLVGDPPRTFNPETGALAESAANPAFSRKDTEACFEWRVRNLPYAADVYAVSVDAGDRSLVVRTSNKKYYKKWRVPELDKAELPLEAAALRWSHANCTLVVSYKKPAAVLKAEAEERAERARLGSAAPGDVGCNQQ